MNAHKYSEEQGCESFYYILPVLNIMKSNIQASDC